MQYKRISTQKINKTFFCFYEDITATATAKIAGVNCNTVNACFNQIRLLIFEESPQRLNAMNHISVQNESEVKATLTALKTLGYLQKLNGCLYYT